MKKHEVYIGVVTDEGDESEYRAVFWGKLLGYVRDDSERGRVVLQLLYRTLTGRLIVHRHTTSLHPDEPVNLGELWEVDEEDLTVGAFRQLGAECGFPRR
jgi:hypothetical protein